MVTVWSNQNGISLKKTIRNNIKEAQLLLLDFEIHRKQEVPEKLS